MLKYLILVSHGGLAEGLKTSLAMFAEGKINQVIAIGLKNGHSVDDFATDFHFATQVISEEDSVVLLADIVGGSPLTTALSILEEKDLLSQTVVMGGMNLPMAITTVLMMDTLEGDVLVKAVLPEAQAALQELKLKQEETIDLEDDI